MDSIVRAALTYWFLYFVLRVLGRRSLQQSTGFEWILIFLLGGVSIQAIVTDDRSLTNAWLVVMTIALTHVGATFLERKVSKLGARMEGTPVPIVEHGVWHVERLSALRILEQDVMAAARQRGLERFDQIDSAIVERNGAVSIVPKKDG
ncbi:MAG TPA: YetF domain-containing protein [Candidatus Elarobacter sp.]|nr:YetF domain-containing protein [Candidatus Elarobacter sp.]